MTHRLLATAILALTLSAQAATLDDPLLGDFSGQYATGNYGEGVVVMQSGTTAFVNFLYLRQDGSTAWAVMPDSRWGPDGNGAMRFFGEIWTLMPTGTVPGTGRLTAKLGYGSFYPSGIPDQARIETHILEMQARTLTRHRF